MQPLNERNFRASGTKAYLKIRELIIRRRRVFVVLLLLMQAAVANYLAFMIRFDSFLPSHLEKFISYLPVLLCIRLVFILKMGLVKGLWRYASVSDLLKIVNSATLGSIVFLLSVRYVFGDTDYPRSVFILDWLLFIMISGGNRFFIRIFREYMTVEPNRRKILIAGAGDTGEMIARDMRSRHDSLYSPVGFIDDDARKHGLTIHGVPIVGGTGQIPEILKRYAPDELLITSKEMRAKVKEIYEMCKHFNIAIKKLPAMDDILGGNISVNSKIGQMLVEANLVTESQVGEAVALQEKEGGRLGAKLVKLGHISENKLISFLSRHYGISHFKRISLEDLLQREPVESDNAFVKEFIAGKSVMVTGAGGSIGSEICRQVKSYRPSRLMLLDRYENSLFDIDLELKSCSDSECVKTVIGDIQDRANLEHIFTQYTPEIIFHAAAFKHVPLMENHPIEAVKNNIFGTRNLLKAAVKHRTGNFVMISTDKAVNPTNVMGATKRVAEFLTINMNSLCGTKFSVVRFGNVLGTNGSVVPIFTEQMKKGGPLTVTHPDAERFFMLIPEAVNLVLTAAAAGKGGEIFVLDMGERVRILDLAENFIRLSGFIPHKEIRIDYIGLRPGEKLCEELFDETEQAVETFHRKLFMALPSVPSLEFLESHLVQLEKCIGDYSVAGAVTILKRIIPNFRNGGEPASMPSPTAVLPGPAVPVLDGLQGQYFTRQR
jgi:FlaA1/EpsC-like NDP-sugar epimerase